MAAPRTRWQRGAHRRRDSSPTGRRRWSPGVRPYVACTQAHGVDVLEAHLARCDEGVLQEHWPADVFHDSEAVLRVSGNARMRSAGCAKLDALRAHDVTASESWWLLESLGPWRDPLADESPDAFEDRRVAVLGYRRVGIGQRVGQAR